MGKLESTQGSLVKRYLGIGKRSHHSSLLKASGISRIPNIVCNKTLSLLNRIFKLNTPLLGFYAHLLAEFIVHGHLYHDTIIGRIVNSGYSPTRVAFTSCRHIPSEMHQEDGVVDTLRYLICHDNFIKPWAEEHILAVLLTRCF